MFKSQIKNDYCLIVNVNSSRYRQGNKTGYKLVNESYSKYDLENTLNKILQYHDTITVKTDNKGCIYFECSNHDHISCFKFYNVTKAFVKMFERDDSYLYEYYDDLGCTFLEECFNKYAFKTPIKLK